MPRNKVLLAASLLVAVATSARAEDPLYHDLGEKPGIAKIVDGAVDNFLADDRIKAIFDDSNIDRIRVHLKEQICVVAGGPCVYTGHSMRDAHRGLHLRDRDFNAVVEDLQNSMDKEGVPFATQNRLLARLAPMHRDVVSR